MNHLYKRLPLLNTLSQTYALFSKGYKAETREQLEKKLRFARNGTIDYLTSLNMIPRNISIQGNDIFYNLEDGSVATKITFKIRYHNLNNSSYKENKEISNGITKQSHHLEHLITKCKSSKGRFKVLDKIYHSSFTKQKEIIKAPTQEELINKTKLSIWNMLKEESDSEIVITGIDITSIGFFQTTDGFEAHYTYTVSKSKKRTNISHNSVEDADGR